MDRRMRWALICSAMVSGINLFIFFYLRPAQNIGARQAAIARLESVQGRIEVLDPTFKSWRSLKSGAPLEQRTTIRSSPSARAQLVFEATGDMVTIEPNSVVVVEYRNGKNRLEVVSGYVLADKKNRNLEVIPDHADRRFVSETSSQITQAGALDKAVRFNWTFPDKDMSHESSESIKPLDVSWEPVENGKVEIWTGLSPETLKLQAKVDSTIGKSTFIPMLGKSYLQGRFSTTDKSTGKSTADKSQPGSTIQFGPLLQISASLTRSFFVVTPDVDLSILRSDDKPTKIAFSWIASNEFDKFILSVNSKSLLSPIEVEIPGDTREHSLLINQEGAFNWTLRAVSKTRSTQAKIQTGRFEIYSAVKNLLTIEKLSPVDSALKVYGQSSKLELKWRLSNQRKTDEKQKPGKLIYGIELTSATTGEIRKFSTEKEDFIVQRIESGKVNVRIQAFSQSGIELSHPLEFPLEISSAETPRWPAGTEEAFAVKEIRPGAFSASWQKPNSEVEFTVSLKRDGKLLENFSTTEPSHVFQRLQPGRYRLEILARGLKNEFQLSPLIETWIVHPESAVEAPQVKKIEVNK